MASFLDFLTGRGQAEAASTAANDTWNKQNAAINYLLDYGNTLPDIFRKMYQPYADTGLAANNDLQKLLADPSSLSSLPGYQFALNQGLQGVDRSAGARGMVNSGAHDKAVTQYATGLADQTYGNQLQRLLSTTGLGITANQGMGQGIQDQLSTRMAGFGGQMQSAGTVGQGITASANAQGQGLMNLINLGSNIFGRFTGGGFGGFGSRGSSFGGMGGGND